MVSRTSGVGGRFVGRTGELAAADAAVRAAASDGTAVLVDVRGDPGIGKTAFVGRVADRARRRGFTIAAGQAGELERAVPFGVFTDALGDIVQRVKPAERTMAPDLAAELGLAVAILGRVPGDRQSDDRLAMHRSVRSLLCWLAASRPLLVILDDMHWADGASLSLLGYLLRRPPPAGVALAVVHRHRQSAAQLVTGLDSPSSALPVTRIELDALDVDEVATLAGIGRRAAIALRRRSDGNPFLVEAIVGHDFEHAGTEPAAGDVPARARAALHAELAGLEPDDLIVARAATVAGDPFEPDDVVAAAGVDEAAAMAALDRLVAADVVRPAGTRRLAFRHPILRRVIYDAAPPCWRRAAHRRLAGALDDRGAPPESRAHHVEAAAATGDLDAVAVLTAAAHATLARAPASAARWSGVALDVLPDTPANRAERLDLRVVNAAALGTSGRLADSAAALHRLLVELPPDDITVRARVAGYCGMVDGLLGRHVEVQASLCAELAHLSAIEQRTGTTSGELVAVLTDLAMGSMFSADYAAMSGWAQQATGRAVAAGNEVLSVAAAAVGGLAAYYGGDLVTARRWCDEAGELAAAVADDAFVARLEPLVYAGYLTQNVGPFDVAVGQLERALTIARRSGQPFLVPLIQAVLAIALVDVGRVDAATRAADDAYEGAVLAGNTYFEGLTSVATAYSALTAGDVDGAIEWGRRGLGCSAEVGPMISANLGLHVASALVVAGRHAEAAATLSAATDGDLAAVEVVQRPRYHEVFALAALAADDRAGAQRWVAAAAEAVAGIDFPRARMYAERVAAAVALAGGDATAVGHALAAAEHGRQAGMPVDEAQCRIVAGRALASAGDRRAAVVELAHAEQALAECGAVRRRDEAARELRRLGSRPDRSRRDGGCGALSAREREVAELVATGSTNRRISAALYISENTVETHVRRILAKLGISSRAAVGRSLASEPSSNARSR